MSCDRLTRLVSLSAVLFVFFSLTATTFAATEDILHHFTFPQKGSIPSGPLLADGNGNFYGTTVLGGPHNLGTVFELSPKTGGGWAVIILHSFSGADGNFPSGRLRLDKDGTLYGTTQQGGVAPTCPLTANTPGCGTVYKLVNNGDGNWTETVLHSFTGASDGAFPNDGVNFDVAGNIYGSTSDGGACSDLGCGKIFKLTNNSGTWTESIVYTFTGGSDGADPSGVIFDSAGNMYGVTSGGGSSCSCGTVFELTPTATGVTEKLLYSFAGGADGNFPISDLVLDGNGNLYGTTLFGGAGSCKCGTVFELSSGSDAWTKATLYSFAGANDGASPVGRLIYNSGVLYGATQTGGGNNSACTGGCGTIFQLSLTSGVWSESILHKFNGTDGSDPESLIQDTAGNLHGVAGSGGMGGLGEVFQLTPTSNSWTESTMHAFDTVDGENSQASASGLISDAGGNLYGTTQTGGLYNAGTVFEMVLTGSTWTEKILYNFKGGAGGNQPQGTLTFDAAGNLYGVTFAGGVNRQYWCGNTPPLGCGTVFKLTHTGDAWTASTIYTFCEVIECPDGSHPFSSLVSDGAGNLYGISATGGSLNCTFGCGVVFRLTPTGDTWTESVLLATGKCFNSQPGLTIDAAGNLFCAAGSEIVQLSNSGGNWTWNNIFSFRGGAAGIGPNSNLIFDASGNLYGTNRSGGADNLGTVFMLSPVSGGWQEKTLFSFTDASDESKPNGGLAFDSAGNLFGTTAAGNGAVFELKRNSGSWVHVRLHTFGGGTDGIGPNVGLAVDASGHVYGTTGVPTSENAGIIFQIMP